MSRFAISVVDKMPRRIYPITLLLLCLSVRAQAGQFDVSAGIVLLPGDRVVVADFMNHRIQVFSQEGKFLFALGSQGAGPGEFGRPTDIAVSPTGSLFVVDGGNNRIQVFPQLEDVQQDFLFRSFRSLLHFLF